MRDGKNQHATFLAAAALALALGGCGKDVGPPPRAAEAVSGVRLATVQFQGVPDEIEAPGTVQSAATAPVAARVMATVLEVAVREGDAVRRGQLLVQLDERELVARRAAAQAALREAAAGREQAARALAAAEAQAEVAARTHERFQYLREQKSVSAQEFDEVEARHRAAQAGLAAARARVDQAEAAHQRAESESRAADTVAGYARIVAPFDGVVVRRGVEPGAMAAPGAPLLVVENGSRYRMEATVDASAAAARGLKRGTKARVRLDALPGREFEGTVVELEAGADPASQTVRARLDLPRDPALRSGLFGRAVVCCGERRALVVPCAAVVERGQLRGVYAVDAQGIARLRLVTLGREMGARPPDCRREVLSGLGEGDRIVAGPAGRELDGKKVGEAK
jgi:RND family efflux transporter MFP subunit